MPDIDFRQANRALDGWARGQGYADFNTYVAAGGTFKHAREDIEAKRNRLHLAMTALYRWQPPKPQPVKRDDDPELADYERANARLADEALAHAEAQVTGQGHDDAPA